VFEGSSEILHLTVDFEGNFTTGAPVTFPGVHGLVCAEELNVLFGYAMLVPNIVEVRSYVIGPSGELSDGSGYSFSIGPSSGSTDTEMGNAMMLQNPASGELWAFGVWMDWMAGGNGLDAVSLVSDATGDLWVTEGPRGIGYVDAFMTLAFNPSGSRLVMPGYSGGCFGWYDLGSITNLPVPADLSYSCSGNFGNSKHAVLRASDGIFYFTRTSTSSIYIAEFVSTSGVVERAQYAAAGDGAHLHLLYDDSVLVSLARDGDVRSFTASTNGLTLTYVSDDSVSTGGFLESSVMVRCSL
jgi:hypothetical protein